MADEKVYTTKEAGVLLHNEGFEDDPSAAAGSVVSPFSVSEADDIHVTLLDSSGEERVVFRQVTHAMKNMAQSWIENINQSLDDTKPQHE